MPKAAGVTKFESDKWEVKPQPKELSSLKTIFDWKDYPNDFKTNYIDYIEEEFKRREEGFWFYNKGKATYITGTHYMYLQWSVKLMLVNLTLEKQTDYFICFGKLAKLILDVMVCVILKTEDLGFHLWHQRELVNMATISSDARLGILSKTGPDAKKMFTDKVVPISVNYPFFFKPIQDGMDRPKTELAYRVPASKLTRRKIEAGSDDHDLQGLDTTIDWKNTGDNSYDGEKLKLLAHDESGKWERPNNILNNWRVTKNMS